MKLAGASIGRTEAGQKTGCGRFATYTSPSVGEDMIVFSTHSGYISGLDVSTGNEIWLTDVGEDVIIHAPAALADGHVYQGCKDGRLFCLDLKTGKIRWEFLTGGAIFESPYIGDGVLYIGSDDGMVYALKGGSAR